MAAPPWHGSLYFASFDQQGHWLARTQHPRRTFLARLTDPTDEPMPSAYQVQVFIPGYAALSADEERRAEALFLAARDAIRRRVLDQLKR